MPIIDMKQLASGLWVMATLLPPCLAAELLESVKPINGQA